MFTSDLSLSVVFIFYSFMCLPVFSSCGVESGVYDKECYTLIYIYIYISSCGVESGVYDKECYTLIYIYLVVELNLEYVTRSAIL